MKTASEVALHRAFAAPPPVPSAPAPLPKKQPVVTSLAASPPFPAPAANRRTLGNFSTASWMDT